MRTGCSVYTPAKTGRHISPRQDPRPDEPCLKVDCGCKDLITKEARRNLQEVVDSKKRINKSNVLQEEHELNVSYSELL